MRLHIGSRKALIDLRDEIMRTSDRWLSYRQRNDLVALWSRSLDGIDICLGVEQSAEWHPFLFLWQRDTSNHRRSDDGHSLWRSEEHTSELQSPDHLLCRLLLEKKINTELTTRVKLDEHTDRDARKLSYGYRRLLCGVAPLHSLSEPRGTPRASDMCTDLYR